VLEEAGLPFDIIPVPKEINPECGMAIESDPREKERIGKALTEANIRIKTAYNRQGSSFAEIDPEVAS